MILSKLMKVVVASLTIITFSYPSLASGIQGIFSCSSGNNNNKPVTYMFNEKLMIRDDYKTLPFEYLTSLNNGQILFIGKTVDEEAYKMNLFALPTDKFKFQSWVELNLKGQGLAKPRTREELILYSGLHCSYLINLPEKNGVGNVFGYGRVNGMDSVIKEVMNNDKSNIDISNLDLSNPSDCKWVNKYIKTMGITNIEEYFVKRNHMKAMNSSLYTTIITIWPEQATIWESYTNSFNQPKLYNCSVLNITVPPIEPPTNPLQSQNPI